MRAVRYNWWLSGLNPQKRWNEHLARRERQRKIVVDVLARVVIGAFVVAAALVAVAVGGW